MISLNLYIVILNYNSASDTIALFNSLLEDGFLPAQIVIVDNHSETADKVLLKRDIPNERIRFLKRNTGYALGNQLGIQEAIDAGIPYVLLLNPDIRLQQHCISRLLATLQDHPEIGVIGPRICFRDAPDVIYSDGGLVNKAKGFYTTHKHFKKNVSHVVTNTTAHPVDYVNGSVFLVSIKALERVGFMRPDFFLYFEETEWCLRAKKQGFHSVVLPTVKAFHSTSSKGHIYHYYMTRNRLLLAKLYPEFYTETKRLVWRALKKDLKKDMKVHGYPSRITRAKLKGFMIAVVKRINT